MTAEASESAAAMWFWRTVTWTQTGSGQPHPPGEERNTARTVPPRFITGDDDVDGVVCVQVSEPGRPHHRCLGSALRPGPAGNSASIA